MDYLHDSFPFPQQQHQPPPIYYQQMSYPPYMQQHQPLDEFYNPYAHAEYADFMQPGLMHEEYDDIGEVSTRPRLTKEQVEVLEAQFQAHPKPNSVVKRQLALQTKLTLPRVANWFQNRRAKAKQQKKQEEFEITQALGLPAEWQGEAQSVDDNDRKHSQSSVETTTSGGQFASPAAESTTGASISTSASTPPDISKEASWASLQRALGQAKAAQHQRTQQARSMKAMPPPELPQHSSTMQAPFRHGHSIEAASMPEGPEWSSRASTMNPWSSPQPVPDQLFDFGFDQQDCSAMSSQSEGTDGSPQDFTHHAYVRSPEGWQESLATPKGIPQQHLPSAAMSQSPEMKIPIYPNSRRGSVADDLTANFGTFVLANSSPHPAAAIPVPESFKHSDGNIDLAARRKRPRPAALTSACIRSRSYGAMTTVSPTFRPGITPPAPHSIRHVKSTGHSLNARYAGIRKASSAQRSPMTFTNFAEAEAFNKLMAQQAVAAQSIGAALDSNDRSLMSTQMPQAERSNFVPQKLDIASQYQLPATQHLTLSSTSPPRTPFGPDYMSHGLSHTSMPPVSAPAQYASFPDYTPPYSAGPLTNSSWSDAPLTSPELSSFPPVTYISSLGYPHSHEASPHQFSHFVLPSDSKTELNLNTNLDQKKTEFFIQEFPNQKEEHAHIAQQLAQQKPKNYVFANTAPSDYDQV